MSELSVAPEKLESFLPVLGVEVTENGLLRDIESGEILTSRDGEKLTVDEIGYLASGEDGDVIPVRDDFSEIVGELSDRQLPRG